MAMILERHELRNLSNLTLFTKSQQKAGKFPSSELKDIKGIQKHAQMMTCIEI